MATFKSVDEYINSFDNITAKRLEHVRSIIKNSLPEPEERISYNIPAYFVDKKMMVYFAGFKNHIGMYPMAQAIEANREVAAKYAHGKSTARFVHSEDLPEEVITQLLQTRLKQVFS
jgi:uncharacterized protein YdhG (YjbR/CyaY superfamily)